MPFGGRRFPNRHGGLGMTTDLERLDRVVEISFRLRSALAIALLALAKVEDSETITDAKTEAREARLQTHSVLDAPSPG